MPSFGESAFAALKAEGQRLGRTLKASECIAILDTQFSLSNPIKKPRVSGKRDEILDALALLNCRSLEQVTRPMWATVATARAQIVEVTPELTPTEIARRAAEYRRKYPGAIISAHALAKHWGEFAPKTPASGLSSALDEPTGWRDASAQVLPESDFGATGAYLARQPWELIPNHLKTAIVRRFAALQESDRPSEKIVPFQNSA